MIRYSFFIGLALFISIGSFAQGPLLKQWDQRYGGTINEELSVFHETADGGFILGGSSYSGIGGDKTQPSLGGADYWIVKTNSLGVKVWDKTFGGSENDELRSLQQTTDGGYILGGSSHSGISGDKTQANWDTTNIFHPTSDYWIIKTDSLGNKLWDKRFGGIYEDRLYSVEQTTDGGYILGGFSYSVTGGDRTQPSRGSADYWIVKTDPMGNKEWDKRFGGSNNDQLYSLKQTADGGYIAGGFTWSQVSGDKTQPNCGTTNNCDFWIVKTDSLGTKQWDRRYGGTESDQIFSIQQTHDHGYILAGFSWSGISGDKTEINYGLSSTADYWIVKIDSTGTKLWDRDFGGVAREDEFGNVIQTADKGYLVSGTSYSEANGNKSEMNLGVEQTWVVKTDSSGIKLWDKTIFTGGHDESGLAIQASDGSYVFANHSNSRIDGYKTQPNRDGTNLTYDYFLTKFIDTTLIPIPEFTASTQNMCVNSCINFNNQTSFGTSYQWSFEGATPQTSTDASPQNICYASPGMYAVTLIASNGNGHDTIQVHDYISVFSPVSYSITRSMDTLYALPGGNEYQWYNLSTAIQGATNYFYIPSQNGHYNVLVTDSNGCKAGAAIQVENVDIRELIGSTSVIFADAQTGELHIRMIPASGACQFSIVNMAGQEVLVRKFIAGVNEPFTITQKLSAGIYTAIVKGANLYTAKRFWVD